MAARILGVPNRYRRRPVRDYEFGQRRILSEARVMKDYDFVTSYGASRTTIEALLTEVAPMFAPSMATNNREILFPEKILTFMKFARGNETYHSSWVIISVHNMFSQV